MQPGKKLEIDLNRITVKEYRSLFDKEQSVEEEDAVIAKVYGVTVEEIHDLPLQEWKRLAKEFFEKAREPLDDPNFQGGSTST